MGKLRFLSGVMLASLLLPAGAASGLEDMGDVLRSLEAKDKVPVRQEKQKEFIEDSQAKAAVEKSGKTVMVDRFELDGNTIVDPAAIDAVIGPYSGQKLAMEDLQLVADAITRVYRQAGYLLAYAYLPPQVIKGGVVKISTVIGEVADIEVAGNEFYDTPFIKEHLVFAKEEKALNGRSLERALVVLNDYKDMDVKVALKPGKEPRTTDVIATVSDKQPSHVSVTYDNLGSEYTSEDRLTIQGGYGNILTTGDYFTVTGLTAISPVSFEDLSYYRFDYEVPMGVDGRQWEFYYGRSIYSISQEFSDLNLEGEALTAGVIYSHPLVKSRLEEWMIKVGFDYKDLSDVGNSAQISHLPDQQDKSVSDNNIRVLSLGTTYDLFDRFNGRNILNFNFHKGVDVLNASGSEYHHNPYDPDFEFVKLTLDYARVQRISAYNNLIFSFASQYSDDVLPSAARFGIGGAYSVRGHDLSRYRGDKGLTASLEFQTAPLFTETLLYGRKLGDSYKLALFGDYGEVHRVRPEEGEDEGDYLVSIGVGMRFQIGKHFTMKYDYAIPEDENEWNLGDGNHLININVSF